ncbi:hypothetical protein D3C73_992700 [compost metagenome]
MIMEVGMKIYYDKATGNVILNTGEKAGNVIETTVEQDFKCYAALAERIPETVGIVQLAYGQYAQDFWESSDYRINVDTGKLEFNYSSFVQEIVEEDYDPPLSQVVNELKARIEANEAAIRALLDRKE